MELHPGHLLPRRPAQTLEFSLIPGFAAHERTGVYNNLTFVLSLDLGSWQNSFQMLCHYFMMRVHDTSLAPRGDLLLNCELKSISESVLSLSVPRRVRVIFSFLDIDPRVRWRNEASSCPGIFQNSLFWARGKWGGFRPGASRAPQGSDQSFHGF